MLVMMRAKGSAYWLASGGLGFSLAPQFLLFPVFLGKKQGIMKIAGDEALPGECYASHLGDLQPLS